jgi:hypothetical protein
MGALGSSNTAATCLLVWGTYEALQRRHSVKWCAVACGQRFSDLAVLVGLVNFVIVKGTHVYLVLGGSVRKEGRSYTLVKLSEHSHNHRHSHVHQRLRRDHAASPPCRKCHSTPTHSVSGRNWCTRKTGLSCLVTVRSSS